MAEFHTFRVSAVFAADPDFHEDYTGSKKAEINIDTNRDEIPDINIDITGDNRPELNIDLNGDGASELVFIQSSGNYTILHVEDNKVYAHSRAYRSFMELKEDGTFVWSGGASDWGIGRIDFDKYSQTRENLAFCRYDYDTKAEVYSIENRAASKEEFDAYYAAQGQKADAVWYEWPAE